MHNHFIWKLVADEKILLKFFGTNEQIDDILTKSPSQEKHQFFKSLLRVCDFELRGSVERMI